MKSHRPRAHGEDVRGQVTDISYELSGAFEAERPQNMVDACDMYVLSVYPFGRDDERPDDYESEVWETGLYGSTGSPRTDWLPALRCVADGRIMVVKEDKTMWRVSTEWVVPA